MVPNDQSDARLRSTPDNNVDAALLKNLELLAIKATPGKTIGARYANVRSTEFFPKLEEVVTTYLSRFFVFVSNPSMYVKQCWEDGQVQEFKEYTSDKLRNVVKYKFSIQVQLRHLGQLAHA